MSTAIEQKVVALPKASQEKAAKVAEKKAAEKKAAAEKRAAEKKPAGQKVSVMLSDKARAEKAAKAAGLSLSAFVDSCVVKCCK
jgi:colicin import membrane protein